MSGSTDNAVRQIAAVHRLCYVMLGNADAAAQATERVFGRLADEAPSFADAALEKTALLSWAFNACIVDGQGAVGIDSVGLPPSLTRGSGVNDAIDVLAALFVLPQESRACTYLHYYEGYTADQVSQICSVPADDVQERLDEGRSMLASVLGGDTGE